MRDDIHTLTDDPAAHRTPRRVVLDPCRVARFMIAGVRDFRPGLSDAQALAVVFERMPDLAAAFQRLALTTADVFPVALERSAQRRRDAGLPGETTMSTPQTATEELLDLVRQARDTDPDLSPAAAIGRVAAARPDLYDRHVRTTTLARDGVALSVSDTASAAADALGLKPRQSPKSSQTGKPTVQAVTPISRGGGTAPSARREIERIAQTHVAATQCSYNAAIDRVFSEDPALKTAWRDQGMLPIFGVAAADLRDMGVSVDED